MKIYFFAFLFLYVCVVNAQGTTPSVEEFEVISIAYPPDRSPWFNREVPHSFSAYVMYCLDSLKQECGNTIDYWEYARLCGGVLVDAKFENQSCPPAYKGKEQLCTSYYRVTDLVFPKFDTIDALKKVFGEYLEVKEYQVSPDYWRWTAFIFINNTKDKISVWMRSCDEENCE